jgi:hypothetical protein
MLAQRSTQKEGTTAAAVRLVLGLLHVSRRSVARAIGVLGYKSRARREKGVFTTLQLAARRVCASARKAWTVDDWRNSVRAGPFARTDGLGGGGSRTAPAEVQMILDVKTFPHAANPQNPCTPAPA